MSRPRGVDEELRKLFIGGLGRSVTEEGFVEYFGQWGQMSDSVIIKDSNGQSKGFGFVTYETVEQTDTCLAVKKGKGHKLGGKDIEVKRAIPRDMSEDPEQTQKNTRMFIGGLGQVLQFILKFGPWCFFSSFFARKCVGLRPERHMVLVNINKRIQSRNEAYSDQHLHPRTPTALSGYMRGAD